MQNVGPGLQLLIYYGAATAVDRSTSSGQERSSSGLAWRPIQPRATASTPSIPLSLPETEQEMSQLDRDQEKRKKRSGRALTDPDLLLGDNFKRTDLKKIAARGNRLTKGTGSDPTVS
ncbi:unnamed protein product [Pleuronectes platessa]|uniref:Uncharacterized protein n=1 Tax=Pleuronectes platessa TaxID=8262 RepID=A0A9N7YI33_PLEPL|nr:unnamed protein product [Pleuronectes platessa]